MGCKRRGGALAVARLTNTPSACACVRAAVLRAGRKGKGPPLDNRMRKDKRGLERAAKRAGKGGKKGKGGSKGGSKAGGGARKGGRR